MRERLNGLSKQPAACGVLSKENARVPCAFSPPMHHAPPMQAAGYACRSRQQSKTASMQGPSQTQLLLAACAADAALAVRAAVHALPMHQRIQKAPTPCKPPPAVAALPDLHGEQAAFACIQKLAKLLNCEVRVVVDPASGQYHALPPSSHSPEAHLNTNPASGQAQQQIYCYLDAVDGTVKLSGLGNSPGCARVINDGAWAVGLAFTEPTTATLDQLTITEFSVACIVDGAAPLDLGPPSRPDLGQPWTPRLDLGQPWTSSTSGSGGDHNGVAQPNQGQPQQPTQNVTPSAGPHGTLSGFPSAAIAFRCSQDPIAYETYAMVFPPGVVGVGPGAHHRSGGGWNGDGGGGLGAGAGGCTRDEYARAGASVVGARLRTSSCVQLNQVFAYLDSFQAFDRATQGPNDEKLACALYAALINRHDGGAFDVLRTYGNLSALLRTMLGWGPDYNPLGHPGHPADYNPPGHPGHPADTNPSGHPGHPGQAGQTATTTTPAPPAGNQPASLRLEPQCGVFLCVNENLANLLPCVPIVLGAQGLATSLDGGSLVDRRLAQGRTSIVYAGNAALHSDILALVSRVSQQWT